MKDMIEVKTADLIGPALDWAVAKAEGLKIYIADPEYGTGYRVCVELGMFTKPYNPSTDWSHGGPLVEKHGVLLSPPEALVHRNGGPNAGWGPSGSWGATIFRNGEHRRQAHSHQTEPLVAAMRCVVGWALGETVQVPKELVQ